MHSKIIIKPAKCEVWSFIHFLLKDKTNKVYRQITKAVRNEDEVSVLKGCITCNTQWPNVHNKLHSSIPEILRTMLQKTVSDELANRNECARWVSPVLKEELKNKQIRSSIVNSQSLWQGWWFAFWITLIFMTDLGLTYISLQKWSASQ